MRFTNYESNTSKIWREGVIPIHHVMLALMSKRPEPNNESLRSYAARDGEHLRKVTRVLLCSISLTIHHARQQLEGLKIEGFLADLCYYPIILLDYITHIKISYYWFW